MYEQLFNNATTSQQSAIVQPTLTTTPITTPLSGVDSATVLTTTQQVETPQQEQNVTPQADAASTKANRVMEKEETTQPTVSGQYTLVLASAITEGNAQSFSAKLKKKG